LLELQVAFQRKLALNQSDELQGMMSRVELFEDNTAGTVCAFNAFAFAFLPFVFGKRGEALDKWSQRVAPDRITAFFVRCYVTKRFEALHAADLSQRNLKPANILRPTAAYAQMYAWFWCAHTRTVSPDPASPAGLWPQALHGSDEDGRNQRKHCCQH
jgi:hypothetical protein